MAKTWFTVHDNITGETIQCFGRYGFIDEIERRIEIHKQNGCNAVAIQGSDEHTRIITVIPEVS